MNKQLFIAWVTAIISMLGSLYFSEIMHFIPCTLCWYQRVLMYPLFVVMGVAVYRSEYKIYPYVLPFSLLGMIISGYHYLLQHIPALRQFEMCTSGVPCSGKYIDWLGFITIPLMAFIAFSIITVMMFMLQKQAKETS
ncbi:disulfide oxidoreductase [Falsibacillus albus]|uniref:Probable disulfide formation protein n=1 Tax=Falsibacillus albus TaxID=2478915 RepID=A0A3L7JZR0_9BACI|nr:disulfide oxidoreductase [Falsibacillus albus]RLQ96236.1 disulfide bond formation protein B [Falsibacillus albus]